MLEIWLASYCGGHVQVTTAEASSQVWQFYHVLKALFHTTLPRPLALTIFHWSFMIFLEPQLEGMYYKSSINCWTLHRHFFPLWSVLCLCINYKQLNKEVSMLRNKRCKIYGYGYKYWWSSFILCQYCKIIVVTSSLLSMIFTATGAWLYLQLPGMNSMQRESIKYKIFMYRFAPKYQQIVT